MTRFGPARRAVARAPRGRGLALAAALLLAPLAPLAPVPARAAPPDSCGTLPPASPTPPPVAAEAYEVMDASTGRVLASLQPDRRLAPASLAKLATLDLALAALQSHRVGLWDPVPIGPDVRRLAATPGITLMGLGLAGPTVPLRDLLLGMVLRSGNDAAVAVADFLAGGVAAFAARMNALAARLGMRATHFDNPDGLPAPTQYTTAADMAILARHLEQRHPDFTAFMSREEFHWNGLVLSNFLDPLLGCTPGILGAKGGWLPSSGYHLVAVARRGRSTLIVVAMGSPTFAANTAAVETLLDWGFAALDRERPPAGFPAVDADLRQPMPAPVRVLLPGPAPGEVLLAFADGSQAVLRAGQLLPLPGPAPAGTPPPRWVPGTRWILAAHASPAAGPWSARGSAPHPGWVYDLVPAEGGRPVSLPACTADARVQALPGAVAWYCGDRLELAPVTAAGLGDTVAASAYALPQPATVAGGFALAPARTMVAVRLRAAVAVFSLPGARQLAELPVAPGRPLRMAWSRQGTLAVAADGRLVLWSSASRAVAARFALGPGTVSALAWRPDGAAAVVLTETGTGTAPRTYRLMLDGLSGRVRRLAAGPMGYVLAVDAAAGLLWREEGVAPGVYLGRPGDGPFTLWALPIRGLPPEAGGPA